MKFLVIANAVEPIDMTSVGDAPIKSNQYRADLLAAGKIELHAHIAGHRAHMWIFDVESIDDLDATMSGDPMSPYFSGSPAIYPLTSYERMREREEAVARLLAPSGDSE